MEILDKIKQNLNDSIKKNDHQSEIDELRKSLDTINFFLDIIKDDIKDILDDSLEIDNIVQTISIFNDGINKEDILEEIRLIQVILRFDRNIELSSEQKAFLNNFIQMCKMTVSTIEQKVNTLEKKNNSKKDSREDLLLMIYYLEDIINNHQVIYKETFPLVQKILDSSNVSFSDKKKLLSDLYSYNAGLQNIEMLNVSKTDFLNLLNILEKYGVRDKLESTIIDNKEEVQQNLNLVNVQLILEYLSRVDTSQKKYNILNYFEANTLLAILLYGDISYIEKTYKDLMSVGYIYPLYYKNASSWINNNVKTSNPRLRHGGNGHGKDTDGNSRLHSLTQNTSLPDTKLNIGFLNTHNVSVPPDGRRFNFLLKKPNYILVNNYNALVLYGLLPQNADLSSFNCLSVLGYSNLMDMIDQKIELGLYQTILKSPSYIQQISKLDTIYLYGLKESLTSEDYRDFITSKHGNNKFAISNLNTNPIKTKEDGDAYLKKHDYSDYKVPNFEAMYEYLAIVQLPLSFSQNIINDDNIKLLDNNFKIDEHTYYFGTQLISRYKVLRIYEALKNSNSFDLIECLMYAITYNSYISADNIKTIANSINYDLTRSI